MTSSLWLIMSIALFVVLSLSAYYYFEKTKEKRLKGVKKQKTMSDKDRAYNEVKKTKGLMRMMERKGKDVEGVDEMVDEAERALERGDASKAKNLASKAKNDLPGKGQNLSMKRADSEDEGPKRSYTVDELDEVQFKEMEEGERKRKELEKQKEKLDSLPDNYLESKFEMNLVEDMLEKESHGEEAEKFYAEAERCFDEEDYSGALKYSIKCKKAIEGEDAGLISGQDVDKKEREGPPEEVKERFPDLVGQEEESKRRSTEKPSQDIEKNRRAATGKESEKSIEARSSISNKVCPECGFEGEEDDSYCPKCGTELVKESACPECGAEIEEGDKFCRNCGAELLESEFVCPECGEEVGEDDEFCPNCGIEFE